MTSKDSLFYFIIIQRGQHGGRGKGEGANKASEARLSWSSEARAREARASEGKEEEQVKR